MKKDNFILEIKEGRLQLRHQKLPQLGSISVDFFSGTNKHRRKFGGGRKEAIAKAVGFKKNFKPAVLDATAGLGRDAFVLASLGCRVHMIERSPIIFQLLEDGLKRARADKENGLWVKERLSLQQHDSCEGLKDLSFKPDVVYLDPMFPEKKKSALVKKEMQMLKILIGADGDSEKLFKAALQTALLRVVVKRPSYAEHIGGQLPNTVIKTQKNRFDIYLS